jgi:hypothetical protein
MGRSGTADDDCKGDERADADDRGPLLAGWRDRLGLDAQECRPQSIAG